jgi:hypothetical protein
MPEVWLSWWCTVTSGRRVDGRRSGGTTSTTGVPKASRPSRTSVATAAAVNIFDTEATANRVVGRTGTPSARLAAR